MLWRAFGSSEAEVGAYKEWWSFGVEVVWLELAVRKKLFLEGLKPEERELFAKVEALAEELSGKPSDELGEVGKYVVLVDLVFRQAVVVAYMVGGFQLCESLALDVIYNALQCLAELTQVERCM